MGSHDVMKRILGALFLALALGGALAVVLPADPAEAAPVRYWTPS